MPERDLDEGYAIITGAARGIGLAIARRLNRAGAKVALLDRAESDVQKAAASLGGIAIEVDIRDEDLRIDTYRASGAGGQHVNKTSSAVRITHLPTNTVAQCQNERSQHKNRRMAMNMLRARLYRIEEEKREAELAKQYNEKAKIGFGSQIRSYVMQPYQLVKDVRTNEQTGNVMAVFDGDIDRFIEAYLRKTIGDEKNRK